MPYAGGTYTVPPGTLATTLTAIDSSDYNAFVADIEAAQNAVRPIVGGGTGGNTAAAARIALGLEIGVNVMAYNAGLTALLAAFIAASAAGPASLDFAEDTDNGTNRVRVIAPAALAADYTLTLPAATGTVALVALSAQLGTEDQVIAGGASVTVKDLGNLSGASLTPDPGDRPIQKITNNGAGSILPGSVVGQYSLTVINTTGAGAITTTGWTLKGDSFDTTTTSKFVCSCIVTGDLKLMTIVKVV